MSAYLASIPILVAVAGVLGAATVRRLRTETALLAREVVALVAVGDAAAGIRADADALAARARTTGSAGPCSGAPRNSGRR